MPIRAIRQSIKKILSSNGKSWQGPLTDLFEAHPAEDGEGTPEGMYQFWNTHKTGAPLRIDFIPRQKNSKAYTVDRKDLKTELIESIVDASEHNSKDHIIEIKGIEYSTTGYLKENHGTVFFLYKVGKEWTADARYEHGEKKWEFSRKNGQWTDGASHPRPTEQSESTTLSSCGTTDTTTAGTQTGSVVSDGCPSNLSFV